MARANLGIVPAQPGTYLLRPRFDKDGVKLDSVSRSTIVAWAISGQAARPVVCDGSINLIDGDTAILQPDGRVETENLQFPRYADYLQVMFERSRRMLRFAKPPRAKVPA